MIKYLLLIKSLFLPLILLHNLSFFLSYLKFKKKRVYARPNENKNIIFVNIKSLFFVTNRDLLHEIGYLFWHELENQNSKSKQKNFSLSKSKWWEGFAIYFSSIHFSYYFSKQTKEIYIQPYIQGIKTINVLIKKYDFQIFFKIPLFWQELENNPENKWDEIIQEMILEKSDVSFKI